MSPSTDRQFSTAVITSAHEKPQQFSSVEYRRTGRPNSDGTTAFTLPPGRQTDKNSDCSGSEAPKNTCRASLAVFHWLKCQAPRTVVMGRMLSQWPRTACRPAPFSHRRDQRGFIASTIAISAAVKNIITSSRRRLNAVIIGAGG